MQGVGPDDLCSVLGHDLFKDPWSTREDDLKFSG